LFLGQYAFGQSFIKGHVSDSSGGDLPGVSIFTADQLNATISMENGDYRLKIPSDKKLTVYYSFAQKRVSREVGPLIPGETITLNSTGKP
jgi:hypothetical protein